MGNCFEKKGTSNHFTVNYRVLHPNISESDELLEFLEMKYSDFGLLKHDIINYEKDTETFKTLLQLLPIYKKTKIRYTLMDRCFVNCPNHIKDALQIEVMKAKKILETMDVVFMKMIIGEFSICADNIDQLLNKFSADQTTLCDVEKIKSLIDLDEENSRRLLIEIDPLLHKETGLYQSLPSVPTDFAHNKSETSRLCSSNIST
ncbi:tegument protein UL51 [macacine betaherpesvirus 9]|uniref:Tegument protein UL51 homolog n=1 Tax=macacine betaherpesvirus 9 TaxID=2560568 RepID=A0A191S3W0_9BETA|nr:tegument protein UL51 [macacine betaherpesvirus 9]ANC96584.1 tegument protein UL51 [macacine betaherpesvirus 9]